MLHSAAAANNRTVRSSSLFVELAAQSDHVPGRGKRGTTLMRRFHSLVVPALLMTMPVANGYANVITDWDETGVAIVQGNAPLPSPPFGPIGGLRIMTVMHIAMF